MIFSETAQKLLSSMCIDAPSYSDKLLLEFDDEASIFNLVIETFNAEDKISDNDAFLEFWKNNTVKSFDSEICNWAYELYNNLGRFFSGGILELYTDKQTEWGAPEIIISKEDVPPSDINLLNDKQIVYRGLSQEEHASKIYGQSWTLDIATAKRFAKDTYSDKPIGIIVIAVIHKNDVVYYDKNNNEYEVIVKFGGITHANEVKA